MTTTTTTTTNVKVVETNASRLQSNGIVTPATGGVTEYTSKGCDRNNSNNSSGSGSGSVGNSAHVSPSRFVVGSTRHVSFNTNSSALGNRARLSSVSLSNTQMQAVRKFFGSRVSGDMKPIISHVSVSGNPLPLQTTSSHNTSITPVNSNVDVTSIPISSSSLQCPSSNKEMTSLLMSELPLPHVSLRQCTFTLPVSNAVGTQSHSCYEKEEERDYFLQKVTPQLHRMLPKWEKNMWIMKWN
ncbi:dual specificity protein phosphatase, putative [Trypanosoma cruzi marinkellei]|uniref:Dual specificity protein phosphatase, putative n=1 Tax=Trypanosoma cruzi marinkellei TaxID=85056 RepID=K2MP72_TRYCR|nr:dual specificity protein phosphatase, putative [Trypanosoma cruzi marinkellei]